MSCQFQSSHENCLSKRPTSNDNIEVPAIMGYLRIYYFDAWKKKKVHAFVFFRTIKLQIVRARRWNDSIYFPMLNNADLSDACHSLRLCAFLIHLLPTILTKSSSDNCITFRRPVLGLHYDLWCGIYGPPIAHRLESGDGYYCHMQDF